MNQMSATSHRDRRGAHVNYYREKTYYFFCKTCYPGDLWIMKSFSLFFPSSWGIPEGRHNFDESLWKQWLTLLWMFFFIYLLMCLQSLHRPHYQTVWIRFLMQVVFPSEHFPILPWNNYKTQNIFSGVHIIDLGKLMYNCQMEGQFLLFK